MIYELRVNLRDTSETVWRKIEIDSNMTFYALNEVLQIIFDWDGFRIHRFDMYRSYGKRAKNITIKPKLSKKYSEMSLKKSKNTLDEKHVKVSDYLGAVKDRAFYLYNIESENEKEMVWEHEIFLEKIMNPEKGVLYPFCTGAKNVVPEEKTDDEVEEDFSTPTITESKVLVKDINDKIQERLSHVISEATDQGNHLWEQLLRRTKDYYRMTPWKQLAEDHVFVVVDPQTKEWMFCSILGFEKEPYGLNVYIGKKGFEALMKNRYKQGVHLQQEQQHCLLLRFDDRQALSEQDHLLIKSNDIPFRGKSAWPKYRSYLQQSESIFNDEEARLMKVALEQTIEVCENPETLSAMSSILSEEKTMLARVPVNLTDSTDFVNDTLDIHALMHRNDLKGFPLAIKNSQLSELQHITNKLAATIEFAMVHTGGITKEQQNWPILVIGANQNDGHVHYQHILSELSNGTDDAAATVKMCQEEFSRMLKKINALPQKIATDTETAKLIESVTANLHIPIIVQDRLPLAEMVVKEIFAQKEAK